MQNFHTYTCQEKRQGNIQISGGRPPLIGRVGDASPQPSTPIHLPPIPNYPSIPPPVTAHSVFSNPNMLNHICLIVDMDRFANAGPDEGCLTSSAELEIRHACLSCSQHSQAGTVGLRLTGQRQRQRHVCIRDTCVICHSVLPRQQSLRQAAGAASVLARLSPVCSPLSLSLFHSTCSPRRPVPSHPSHPIPSHPRAATSNSIPVYPATLPVP